MIGENEATNQYNSALYITVNEMLWFELREEKM